MSDYSGCNLNARKLARFSEKSRVLVNITKFHLSLARPPKGWSKNCDMWAKSININSLVCLLRTLTQLTPSKQKLNGDCLIQQLKKAQKCRNSKIPVVLLTSYLALACRLF